MKQPYLAVPEQIHPYFTLEGREGLVKTVRERFEQRSPQPIHYTHYHSEHALLDDGELTLDDGEERVLDAKIQAHTLYPEYGAYVWRVWVDREYGLYIAEPEARWVENPAAHLVPEFNPVTPSAYNADELLAHAVWAMARLWRGAPLDDEDIQVLTTLTGFAEQVKEDVLILTPRGKRFLLEMFPEYFDGRPFPRVRRFLKAWLRFLRSV